MMAKEPMAQRQVLCLRNDCAASGPVNAVQMKGVEANPKANARLRRPDVSAMKMSRIMYNAS